MTRILLIACLAASAGAHVALASAHGLSFHVAAALLALAAAALAVRPSRSAAWGAAGLLAALLVGYVALRGDEPLDAVAVATKVVEAAGLLLAVRLGRAADGTRVSGRLAALVLAAAIAATAAVATPAAEAGHAPHGAPHGH